MTQCRSKALHKKLKEGKKKNTRFTQTRPEAYGEENSARENNRPVKASKKLFVNGGAVDNMAIRLRATTPASESTSLKFGCVKKNVLFILVRLSGWTEQENPGHFVLTYRE